MLLLNVLPSAPQGPSLGKHGRAPPRGGARRAWPARPRRGARRHAADRQRRLTFSGTAWRRDSEQAVQERQARRRWSRPSLRGRARVARLTPRVYQRAPRVAPPFPVSLLRGPAPVRAARPAARGANTMLGSTKPTAAHVRQVATRHRAEGRPGQSSYSPQFSAGVSRAASTRGRPRYGFEARMWQTARVIRGPAHVP